ncbi:MAG: YeeE/YedE family protein, partial [Burkholderiales bacterium]
VTLYHAAFGFTAAYRRLLFDRDGTGARAQLAMLGVATCLFAPVLAAGSFFGSPVVGAIAPVGWQVAIGAFVFGMGMQLGNGCGSGTLYSLGGGSTRMAATLVAFCAGGFAASLHMAAWQTLPDAGEIVLGERIGWPGAVALQVGALAALYALIRAWERSADSSPPAAAPIAFRPLSGPWPPMAAAVILALLNFATLSVAGHPWSITWGMTLWGAKAALALGWDPSNAPFWSGEFQHRALDATVLDDATSVMDIGIVLGAFAAAALAGRLAPSLRMSKRSLAAAVVGGLLMGYGARLAYGCNIGAFFSGISSTSLHGWLWIAAALPGNWIGARLRPRFGLAP